MKTPHDPRHIQRQELVQELFKSDFHKQSISKKASEIISNLKEIDEYITIAAPEFPVDKINRVDRAILRLAVFELIVEKRTPPNVVIDEAVELAKEFGGESSPAFINGALGKLKNYDTTTHISK